MTFNISIIDIKEGDQTYYRDQGWCLYAFKFCEGKGGIGYVPTWFALNPKDWSENIDIFYQPTYSVFYNKFIQISDDTIIRTSTRTDAIPLGSKVTLNENNRLEVTKQGRGAGAIEVTNNSASGRALLGLTGPSEAHVDDNAPFAVFDVAESNILTMQPVEKVLICLAALNIQQGIVRSNTFAPGVLLDLTAFSAADNPKVNLLLNRTNNGIIAADDKSAKVLTEVDAKTPLSVLGPQ
ncbi:MAG: hypothetical protein EWV75_15625 [Microcystis wesenbergii Mw_QC_S_20081001_S30D]|jgi:hypothetical protein|uniref:Uncharacterized protein n=1 Tax=Microcystis wesenbergii Mw_QC_S_20081001_S30D TaxID=2486245 RepID=A0A552JFJ9_9CHRO|nr:MAG: hypothetical protein EWV75_15625 [Microcystis wesenbergii Mw_QC_S_20081001_S30D]TRU99565.1 MAG: hypothetical protein EWV74_13770 [Microcystis wesenbergii Mw_QC_S_20081001_S30]TRV00091.1 MAG: hypothetical protein EWV73_11810 [Microcystis wesenbergii Mw_QC_B_20070930_S4D]TRV15132.1 MAG: hypothetical protein EWV89_08030 [Microcystis wesenbergii Mw_QC_B_20070930_S4]